MGYSGVVSAAEPMHAGHSMSMAEPDQPEQTDHFNHTSEPSVHSSHDSHNKPVHNNPSAEQKTAVAPMMSMEHSEHSEHSEQQALPKAPSQVPFSQSATNPAALRSPDYSNGYLNQSGHHMMSNPNLWSIEAEALELIRDAGNTDDHTGGHYDLKFWYGNDNNRLYLKAAGEIEQSQLQQHSTSALWWRPFSPFWNTVSGINLEANESRKSQAQKNQIWLAGGISGLAPYWFDLDAMAYVSTHGHSRFELHGRYDLYITQKLVLQPELELMAYGKTDTSYAYGAGLAQISSAVRLRYDIRPQFSPYIGVERERSLGKTADFHSAQTGQTKLLLGMRFWY